MSVKCGVGRVLSYDVQTGIVVLIDGGYGLFVDVLLCLDGQSWTWATERLSTIIALGQLERAKVGFDTLLLGSSDLCGCTGAPRCFGDG